MVKGTDFVVQGNGVGLGSGRWRVLVEAVSSFVPQAGLELSNRSASTSPVLK